MNQRRNSILFELINSGSFLRVDELANEYAVSNRTIRNDLLEIDNLLIKNNFKPLERNHSKGAKICVTEALLKFFQELNNSDAYLKGKEIQIFMNMKLLFDCQYIEQEFFSKIIDASKSTIYTAYKTIPVFVEKENDLTIKKNENQSYKIEGRFIKRLEIFLTNFLDNIEISKFYDCVFRDKYYDSSFFNSIKKYILHIEHYPKFKEIIVELEKLLQIEFDDISYIRLLIFFDYISNVSIFINDDLRNFENTNEYDIAKQILKRHFNIMNDKKSNIIINLLAEIILTNKVTYSGFSNKAYEDIADDLISQVEIILNKKIINKDQLRINVAMHLKPMLYRVMVHNEINNPLFEEIIDNYSLLYCAVDDACLLLKKYGYENINPQEISFLTLHFLSVCQSDIKIRVKKEKILIVSAEGRAVSLNLKYMLRKYFELDYVECISLREFNVVNIDEYDAVITTTHLQLLNKKIIKISPNFNDEDIEKLNKHFKGKKYETDLSVVHEIVRVTKQYCNIEDITGFQKDIINILINEKRILNNYNCDEVIFNQNLIQFDYGIHTIYEAVELAASVLEKNNYINKSYSLKINSNIKEFGGYMVISPMVMLAHAGVDDGVNYSSFSLLINENGYSFKNRFGNTIKIVMVLAITDEHRYLNFLKKVIEITNDENLVSKIIKSKDKFEIYKIFQMCEY